MNRETEQPPWRGAPPSEGGQGDEWVAYVALDTYGKVNAGSPTGREPYGDAVPVVVAGVTTCQGGRESRPRGEGAQVVQKSSDERHA
jgi:hypothetical protein